MLHVEIDFDDKLEKSLFQVFLEAPGFLIIDGIRKLEWCDYTSETNFLPRQRLGILSSSGRCIRFQGNVAFQGGGSVGVFRSGLSFHNTWRRHVRKPYPLAPGGKWAFV
jgi:hypothetical protein